MRTGIGDTRTIISGQMAYSASFEGHYGELKCLADPKSCNSAYDGPYFVDAELAKATEKSGEKRSFKPAGEPMGPRAVIAPPPAGVFHADVYFDFKSTRLRADAASVLDIAWFIYANRLALAGYPIARLHPRLGAWLARAAGAQQHHRRDGCQAPRWPHLANLRQSVGGRA